MGKFKIILILMFVALLGSGCQNAESEENAELTSAVNSLSEETESTKEAELKELMLHTIEPMHIIRNRQSDFEYDLEENGEVSTELRLKVSDSAVWALESIHEVAFFENPPKKYKSIIKKYKDLNENVQIFAKSVNGFNSHKEEKSLKTERKAFSVMMKKYDSLEKELKELGIEENY